MLALTGVDTGIDVRLAQGIGVDEQTPAQLLPGSACLAGFIQHHAGGNQRRRQCRGTLEELAACRSELDIVQLSRHGSGPVFRHLPPFAGDSLHSAFDRPALQYL